MTWDLIDWSDENGCERDFWAIVSAEGAPRPRAVFDDRAEAEAWLSAREALDREDDRHISDGVIVQCCVTENQMLAWNSHDAAPSGHARESE